MARLPFRIGVVVLAVVVSGGLVLGALEQQAYRVFTSNSKAVAAFALEHPTATVYGSVNNANIARVAASMNNDRSLRNRVKTLADADGRLDWSEAAPSTTYAVIDRETMNWGTGAIPLEKAPGCWTPVQSIVPTGFGLGRSVTLALIDGARMMPNAIGARAIAVLAPIASPAPATLYRIDPPAFWCKPS
jgi:hypothetical protein